MGKDYYSVLGLDRSASQDDIKKAFKTLARKWHPDRCKDESKKKEHEEKFKEISEAYAVLSDPKKKEEYDNPMTGGQNFHFDGFGDDFGDLFKHFGFGGNPFGNPFGGGRPQQEKGQSIRIFVDITLEDIFNGVNKKVKYNRLEKCETCNGSGKTSRSKIETCKDCGGTGTLYRQVGAWQQMFTCPNCQGKGNKIVNPCPNCGGEGLVTKSHEISFDIPKGVLEGTQIMLNGEGNSCKSNNGINGDLVVVVREKNHELFERNGNDLYFELNVPVIDAILGSSITVKTIEGKELSTTIPSGVEDGTKIKFKGFGMPIYGRDSIRGNMIGIVKIKMPKNLTSEQKDLLTKLKETMK